MIDYYKFEHISKNLKKEELKEQVKSKLVEHFIMSINPAAGEYGPTTSTPNTEQAFSYEQQTELLKLQMEQRRFEAAEREKERDFELKRREKENELELKRIEADLQKQEYQKQRDLEQRRTEHELELEKLKQHQLETEREADLQREKLKLIAEGKMRGDGESSRSSVGIERNLSHMIRFLPKFNDREPDIFFSLFEGIAEEHEWSDSDRTLLLQTTFTVLRTHLWRCRRPSEKTISASKKRY